MKKILSIFVFIFFNSALVAQFPITQQIGSDSTLIRVGTTSKGAIRGSFIPSTYTDTTTANLGRIDDYPFAIISTSSDGNTWQRDLNATGWVLLAAGGGGATGAFWNLTGNFVPVTPSGLGVGHNDPYNALNFKTNALTRLSIPVGGIVRSSAAVNKYLMQDTVTKELYFGDGGSGSGGGWDLTGNSGTNPSINWLGTNDSIGLRFKVNGRDAGYVSRAGFGASNIVVNYTGAYTTYGQLAGFTLTPKVIAGTENGSGNTLYGSGAGLYLSATYDTTASTTSDANVLVGLGAGHFIQKRSFVTGTGRNTFIGYSSGFHATTPGETTGLGVFTLETAFRPTKSTAVGSNALRTANDASQMTSIGAYASAYTGCVVRGVTINSSSSDWTTATATFSAPYTTGSPGACTATATGTVTIVGGEITGIIITNPGCGYSSITTTFYTGYTSYYPTVTITGDGTSVDATVSVICGESTTSVGHAAGWLSRAPQYQLYLGEGSEPSTRYWDAYGGAIGKNSGVHSSISALTKLTNAWAIGTNAKVSTDRTFAIGATDTTLKVVINNHTGDSILSVYSGGLYVERGGRFAGLPSGLQAKRAMVGTDGTIYMADTLANPITGTGTNSYLAKFTSSGVIGTSVVNEYAAGTGGIGVDDITRAVTTTNPFLLVLRNSYAGDATSNAHPMMWVISSSTSATQKYLIGSLATGMPSGSAVSNYIGRNTSSHNSYLQTFVYIGNGNDSNYLEEQFPSVANVSRTYASGNKTIGNSITADNGYRLEVGGKVKINDSLKTTGGVQFSGLPTTVQARVAMFDANGDLYSADTTGLFGGGGGGTPGGSDNQVQYNDGGAFGGAAGVEVTNANITFRSQGQAATDVAIVAKGHASQSANIFEVQSSAAGVLANVTAAGRVAATDYYSIVGTDIQQGNVLGTGYNVLMAGATTGIKFRDNTAAVPFIWEFGFGSGPRAQLSAARMLEYQGTDVASAAGAIALSYGNTFEITGTSAITLISNVNWQNGSVIHLVFTSTATLTDGTANSGTDIGMELAGNTDFSASAGATWTGVLSEVGGTQRWRELSRSVN